RELQVRALRESHSEFLPANFQPHKQDSPCQRHSTTRRKQTRATALTGRCVSKAFQHLTASDQPSTPKQEHARECRHSRAGMPERNRGRTCNRCCRSCAAEITPARNHVE